ncbi:MAG: sugar phosphate isomerase/epimerase [Lachnospiraceae bacterium]|nr:sugar phosphate isomerase/epimerase [Lachnospiraceae bacterium]
MFKIGTLADWFGVGIIEGIKESAKCGATGVQLYAADSFDPRTADKALIEEVKSTAAEYGQKITALCCELGGYGLERAADNPDKIAYLKECGRMAAYLDCPVLTTHLGVVPKNKLDPTYNVLLQACREIGSFLAPIGVTLAIETGPEDAATLRAFIDDCGEGVGVNYDPANLVMIGRYDEVESVRILSDKIVHTHAKDGINITPFDSGDFYHKFAEGGLEWMATSNICAETPLGQGSVRWPEYLKALQEIGYDGYLTIEHEVQDKADEIREAVDFLKKQMEVL